MENKSNLQNNNDGVDNAANKPAWNKPSLKTLDIFDAEAGFVTPSSDGTGFS